MAFYRRALFPLLSRFDPERVHDLTLGMLAGTARQRGIPVVMPETGGPLPGPHGLLDEAQG